MSNEKQNKNHEKHEKKQIRRKENKRKNILNACSCCRIKKIRCTGGARCACCTRNNLVCFYPTPKKRGPKHRQENTSLNGINHVPINNPIHLLSERVSNVEDMLSKEPIDDKEASTASFDKLLQSVTALVNEPSTLFLPGKLLFLHKICRKFYKNSFFFWSNKDFPDTVNSYMNPQYGNSTNSIDKKIVCSEDSQYVLSSASNTPLYQRNNMTLDSHSQFPFGEQSYMLHNTLPTFIENNMLIPETYYTLATEEPIFTGEPSSDEYPI
ncbi:4709_t:CDS:2 [Cetraspora pellucida]|uniref:4709_t:CDS:1 n=1 Tax=Cetraspora pellucida TaxID=1433469 RepID=A0ACA9K8A8_9GLOM|nr:4709_t:CDS:2 [Cetraspora pellucida]